MGQFPRDTVGGAGRLVQGCWPAQGSEERLEVVTGGPTLGLQWLQVVMALEGPRHRTSDRPVFVLPLLWPAFSPALWQQYLAEFKRAGTY